MLVALSGEAVGTRLTGGPQRPNTLRDQGMADNTDNTEKLVQRWMIWIFVTVVTVLAWSVVMVAFGQAAAIVTLAPALGWMIQQIVTAARPQPTRGDRPVTVPPETEEDREQ